MVVYKILVVNMTRRHYFKSIQSFQDLESSYLNNYISDLERKVDEKSQSPTTINSFFLQQKPSISKQKYKEDLKHQIDEKYSKKLEEKQLKAQPGIDMNYHGYPNLPQTPREIRRQRELNQMNQFRKDLSAQLAIKHEIFSAINSKDLESVKQSNSEDFQRYLQEANQKRLKKETEKETLVSSWNQAKKAKELKNILEAAERNGVIFKNYKSVDLTHEIKKTEDESSQYDYIPVVQSPQLPKSTSVPPANHEITKSRNLKDKARKIQEKIQNKEKETYSYKIKEIVKEAKKQREVMQPKYKKSRSPVGSILPYPSNNSLFASQKSFQINKKVW